VIDRVGTDGDVGVLIDDADIIFAHLRADRGDVLLPQRIGRACADIGVERATLEQMPDHGLGTARSVDRQRAGAAEDPAGDDEERQLADMVVMQMCQ